MTFRNIGALILAFCTLVGGSSFAQGTPVPYTVPQYFDSNGDPLASGGICTYEAGTTTLATVYTTAALTVAHPNPVRLNAAGRPTVSGVTLGIFLSPGRSYKFVLKDSTVTTCSPDTGVTIWTVDNIQAVPGSSASFDVTGTAGEAIAAGESVYLSTGDGGTNAGQWYKTDSDVTTKSTAAFQVGMAPSAIASGATGTIRLAGSVTVTGPLSTGAPYYVGATAGAIVTTPPTNAVRLGQADSATSIIIGNQQAPVSPRGPPCGRLTLTSGTPVTSSDVTAATTLYYTPAGSCNGIFLYDGTAWAQYAFSELSIAVPATTNTGYDVYAYVNSGVVSLELTAWTSLTARATNPVLQNGVYVKTGALTRRLLGSFRTTGVSGQTEDSVTKRYLSNLENRVERQLLRVETTASWAHNNATVTQANGAAANQVEVFVCMAGQWLDLSLTAHGVNDGGNAISVGIGEGSTTTYAAGAWMTGTGTQAMTASLRKYPAIGAMTYQWNESGNAGGNTTFYGTNTVSGGATQSGLRGWIKG